MVDPLGGGGVGASVLGMIGAQDPLILQEALRQPTEFPSPRRDNPGDAISLTDEEEARLAGELCSLLQSHDQMMQGRWDVEEMIRDAYALKPSRQTAGVQQGAENLSSELLMTLVDQSAARLATMFLDASPMIQVKPIVKQGMAGDLAAELSSGWEAFMNAYFERGTRSRSWIKRSMVRLAMVGTSAQRLEWRDDSREVFYYAEDGKRKNARSRDRGRLHIDLIFNRDMVVWPPSCFDWQECEVAGHRCTHSLSAWRILARRLGVPAKKAEMVERFEDASRRGQATDARTMIDRGQMALTEKQYTITELWCARLLLDRPEPMRYRVILHEDSKTILRIEKNPLHSQKHPYYPIRSKVTDESSWANGVGHEALQAQYLDSALLNLQVDGLMATAYSLVGIKTNSTAEVMVQRPSPGQVIPTENPREDIVPIELGGEPSGIAEAQAAAEYRARRGTGIPALASGQGDPVMRSGAGTGAVLALLQEAGRKLKFIDDTIRDDWEALVLGAMEHIAQYAPEGVYYAYAGDNAEVVSLMRFIPSRGNLEEMFHVKVAAPNADTSYEALRQAYLMIWQFAMNHLQMAMQLGGSILQMENPAGIVAFQRQVFDFSTSLAEKVIRLHNLVDLPEKLPRIPPATPQDMVINQLQGELQQVHVTLQQQAEQIAQFQAQAGVGERTVPQPFGEEVA